MRILVTDYHMSGITVVTERYVTYVHIKGGGESIFLS